MGGGGGGGGVIPLKQCYCCKVIQLKLSCWVLKQV